MIVWDIPDIATAMICFLVQERSLHADIFSSLFGILYSKPCWMDEANSRQMVSIMGGEII